MRFAVDLEMLSGHLPLLRACDSWKMNRHVDWHGLRETVYIRLYVTGSYGVKGDKGTAVYYAGDIKKKM